MHHHRNIAARMGAWSAAHRKKAILGWIAFVIVSSFIGGAVGMKTLDPIDTENGESYVADQAIDDAGFVENVNEQVLVQGKGGIQYGDDQMNAGIRDVVSRLEKLAVVQNVKSPVDVGNDGQVSKDGRSALVTFEIKGDLEQGEDRVDGPLAAVAAAQKANPDVRIEEFGDASATKALTKSFEDDFRRAETLSLPITLAVLLLAFGALVAAGLPLLLAFTAVLATLGLVAPLSQLFPVDQAISSVILLIGLAVGVDYCMFYVRREMEERDAGRSPADALQVAAATSGRAILVSGFTVMVAMAGMFFAGNKVFTSFAFGTITVVAVAMLGSVTALPAMLSWLGKKGWTEKGRVPYVGKLRHRRHESRIWSAILTAVLKRPLLSAGLSAGFLIFLALPALGMQTVNTGVQGIPRDLPIMQTYDRIQAAFPGGPLPAVVVVQADDVRATPVQRGIDDLKKAALATGRMSDPIQVDINPRGTLAIVSIPLEGTGTDDASDAALASLRGTVIPETMGAVDGVEVNTSGITAASKDFNDTMTSHLPLVFGFVLLAAFAILLVTFRSIVVPIKAIILNLLSVGAAYGVLVWVFQDGHLESLLGFESIGGITSWLPLFLFVVLFGLSMDYHVFILSRVRELVDHGRRTEDAVGEGIKATAGVVTSAAVVMVAVFAIFATLGALDFKMMGVGLSVAVALDATVVRAVLLPATMKLLGEWNWYLPSWLAWLPEVEHEGELLRPDEIEFGEMRPGQGAERVESES